MKLSGNSIKQNQLVKNMAYPPMALIPNYNSVCIKKEPQVRVRPIFIRKVVQRVLLVHRPSLVPVSAHYLLGQPLHEILLPPYSVPGFLIFALKPGYVQDPLVGQVLLTAGFERVGDLVWLGALLEGGGAYLGLDVADGFIEDYCWVQLNWYKSY